MNFSYGDHIATTRFGYTHHGIYAGDDMVVEHCMKGVQCVSLSEFAEGHEVYVVDHKNRRYDPEETVSRAMSKIGEDDYNLVFNNCEHFANWCVEGEKESKQVQNASAVAAVGAAGAVMSTARTVTVASDTVKNLMGATKMIAAGGALTAATSAATSTVMPAVISAAGASTIGAALAPVVVPAILTGVVVSCVSDFFEEAFDLF